MKVAVMTVSDGVTYILKPLAWVRNLTDGSVCPRFTSKANGIVGLAIWKLDDAESAVCPMADELTTRVSASMRRFIVGTIFIVFLLKDAIV